MAEQKCWARRHLTPSQYVTYDTMRHLRGKAPNPPICYASILKIANNSGLGRDTTINNIQAMLTSGWLTPAPDSFERWSNNGRWVSRQYLLRDDTHDHCADCPLYKYNLETGENVAPNPPSSAFDRVEILRHRPRRELSTPTVSKVADVPCRELSTQGVRSIGVDTKK
jgi:hypothetical protein